MNGIDPIFLPSLYLPWWLLLGLHGTVDPYALWGIATKFRALAQVSEGGTKSTDVFSFAVEMYEPYDKKMLEDLLKRARMVPPNLAPKAFVTENPFPDTIGEHVSVEVPLTFKDRASRFLTVRIDWSKAPPKEREEAMAFLMGHTVSIPGEDPPVKRIQWGDPRGWNNLDRTDPGPPPTLKNPNAPSPRLVLGVIDDEGAFAHAALRETKGGTATRVWALWDQTTTRRCEGPWTGPLLSRYGRQLDQAAMNAALEKHHDGQVIDEEALYADRAIDMPRLLRRASHGVAVTSLIAGAWRAAPQMPQHGGVDCEADLDIEPRVDAAGQAPVVMVQLPVEQTTLSSGRWLAVNALDGLHYILDVARGLGRAPSVVVNMSYGAIAGPHDGSGLLERAIDDMVCRYKRDEGADLAVVLAAGNSHGVLRGAEDEPQGRYFEKGIRVPSGVHAKSFIPRHTKRVFTLFIPPDKQTETHVEFWFDRVFTPGLYNTDPSKRDPGARIVVTPPDGSPSLAAECGESDFWPEDDIQAGLIFCRRVAQGDERSMALLCVAATQVSSTRVSASAGRWRIEVFNDLDPIRADPLAIEAWVERDDTTVGARRGQSARFVEAEPPHRGGVKPDDSNTLTNVATGGRTFATGAVFAQAFALDGPAAAYTAEGTDSEHGPLLSAVAEDGQALRGIRASGSQSGMVVRANGTSMAAPQAARWIANELAAGRTLADIRSELERPPRDARVGHIV